MSTDDNRQRHIALMESEWELYSSGPPNKNLILNQLKLLGESTHPQTGKKVSVPKSYSNYDDLNFMQKFKVVEFWRNQLAEDVLKSTTRAMDAIKKAVEIAENSAMRDRRVCVFVILTYAY